jgi:hypothetical protein
MGPEQAERRVPQNKFEIVVAKPSRIQNGMASLFLRGTIRLFPTAKSIRIDNIIPENLQHPISIIEGGPPHE